MYDESYGRMAFNGSKTPFYGLSGKTYTIWEAKERALCLARAFFEELDFKANHGNEWDKVVAIFSFNTVRMLHDLNWYDVCQNHPWNKYFEVPKVVAA